MTTPNRNLLFSLGVLVLATLTLPWPVRADDAAAAQEATTESRLRDALRNSMLQLQDAQGQVATLQASQAQSDKDNADLKAKIDTLNGQIKALGDQAAADKAASDKTIADLKQNNQDLVTEMVDTLSIQINLLNKTGTDDKATLAKSVADMKSKNPDLAKALDQYGTDIELWKTGYYQYVQYAAQTEAARARAATEAIMLRRLVDDRETKNLELYNTASEILTRYEKYGLGEALLAKEPFIGVTRVKLQELVQDYKDKLLSDKIKIGQPPTMIAQGPPASPGPAPMGKPVAKLEPVADKP
jgi:chromosome segregation ATPase